MTPAQLSRTVLRTVRRAVAEGDLGATVLSGLPERVVVEAPPRRGGGDYALSVAFPLAEASGMPPYDVARVLRDGLGRLSEIQDVELAGGGFLNVTLTGPARAALVAELWEAGRAYEPRADDPAADVARWSAATGDEPASLTVRTTQSSSLFRVQYAHARTRALARNAHDLGFHGDAYAADLGSPRLGPAPAAGRALLALLADHQRVSEQAVPGGQARQARQARHARHLEAVAGAFFDFHDRCPPLPRGDEKPGAVHRARLALVEATGAVLAGGLHRLGVTAPAHL